jgi:hypothetical protein
LKKPNEFLLQGFLTSFFDFFAVDFSSWFMCFYGVCSGKRAAERAAQKDGPLRNAQRAQGK